MEGNQLPIGFYESDSEIIIVYPNQNKSIEVVSGSTVTLVDTSLKPRTHYDLNGKLLSIDFYSVDSVIPFMRRETQNDLVHNYSKPLKVLVDGRQIDISTCSEIYTASNEQLLQRCEYLKPRYSEMIMQNVLILVASVVLLKIIFRIYPHPKI